MNMEDDEVINNAEVQLKVIGKIKTNLKHY
jgi:hypothetical protein